jgi:hypothetical protein
LILLLLMGCGDQAALDRAEADVQRMEAAASIEATRVAAAHALKMEEIQAEKDLKEWEINHKRNTARKDALLVGLSITLLGLIWGVGALGLVWLKGVFRTAREAAEMRGRLVKVDGATGTWPVLIGDDAIYQIGTGRVLRKGEPREASPQAEMGEILIRALGVSGVEVPLFGAQVIETQREDRSPGSPGLSCDRCHRAAQGLIKTDHEWLCRGCR